MPDSAELAGLALTEIEMIREAGTVHGDTVMVARQIAKIAEAALRVIADGG